MARYAKAVLARMMLRNDPRLLAAYPCNYPI
jgi:hypothetical protein